MAGTPCFLFLTFRSVVTGDVCSAWPFDKGSAFGRALFTMVDSSTRVRESLRRGRMCLETICLGKI
jgi:hypothetical protein